MLIVSLTSSASPTEAYRASDGLNLTFVDSSPSHSFHVGLKSKAESQKMGSLPEVGFGPWGFSNCGAGPGAFSDRGCLVSQLGATETNLGIKSCQKHQLHYWNVMAGQ